LNLLAAVVDIAAMDLGMGVGWGWSDLVAMVDGGGDKIDKGMVKDSRG